MKNETEFQLEQIKRQLMRTKLCLGILFFLEVARFFPGLNKILEESFLPMILILGGVILTITIVYLVEQIFSAKKQ